MFSLTSFSKKKPQLALADADHITQHFALEHWRQTGSSATALYYAALVPLADTDARYDSDSDLFRLMQDVLVAPSLSTSSLALAVDDAGFQFQITEDETAGLTRSGAAQVAIVPEDGLSRCTLFRVNHWYPSRMKQVQGNFQASLCAKDVAVSLYAIAELDSDTQVLRREASTLASALPARAASRAAVVTAPRRAVAILESTSEEVSTAESRAYAVSALASALEACSPEMEASLLASSEASAVAVTPPGERWPPWCLPPAA